MITIVGGAGFIGTRLCETLAAKKVDFEILDLKESQSYPEKTKIVDIRDFDALKAAVSGQTIINLAAIHRDDVRDRTLYYTTNVEGTRNICKVADEAGISSIVFTSTVAVYGFAAPETGEDGVINPFNDYGKSKYQAEEVLRGWYAKNQKGRNLAIIRPTVVFGEGNRGNVYNLCRQIVSGKFLMVGSGRNRKSMAYIGNIAAFLALAATQAQGYGVYNYVDKPDFDMNTLVTDVKRTVTGKNGVGLRLPFWLGMTMGSIADIVARVTGANLPISSIRVKKFCSTTTFSCEALEALSFSAPYTLAEGLERTLEAEFLNPDQNRQVFFTE